MLFDSGLMMYFFLAIFFPSKKLYNVLLISVPYPKVTLTTLFVSKSSFVRSISKRIDSLWFAIFVAFLIMMIFVTVVSRSLGAPTLIVKVGDSSRGLHWESQRQFA